MRKVHGADLKTIPGWCLVCETTSPNLDVFKMHLRSQGHNLRPSRKSALKPREVTKNKSYEEEDASQENPDDFVSPSSKAGGKGGKRKV